MPINDPPMRSGPAYYEPRVITTFTPSIGRIVHYVSYGSPVQADGTQRYRSECRAAIITEVEAIQAGEPDDRDKYRWVCLAVLNPTGMFFTPDCQHDETEKRGGTWHWPERTP